MIESGNGKLKGFFFGEGRKGVLGCCYLEWGSARKGEGEKNKGYL